MFITVVFRGTCYLQTSPIDEDLAIGTLDRSLCNAVGEDTAASQLTRQKETVAGQTEVLCAQLAMLTAQSEPCVN